MDDQSLNHIESGLSEILEESYKWCKSDDLEISRSGAKINSKAYELKCYFERRRNKDISRSV